MAASKGRKQLTERGRFWLRHLERWQPSGLSQVRYCREHQLSVAAFGWWKGQLSSRRKQPQAGTGACDEIGDEGTFVELSWPDIGQRETSASVVYEIALAGGRRLRLGPHFKPEQVRQLVTLLERGC
ncbi:MAG: hypothetical protein JW993_13545 [Sedimentisphaerales bacterium]|nr:hypothetical protein [Sedimentisphaerales bacterium]